MKKMIAILLILLISVSVAACAPTGENDKLSIVCTAFPQYDWIKNILGDRLADTQLTLLTETGVDIHNYQPSAADMVLISSCDMLVYIGGTSDAWAEAAMKNSVNENAVSVSMMQVLGDKIRLEEETDGMQTEPEEDEEYDEHVWLSVRNAVSICEYVSQKLELLDLENAQVYESNTAAYVRQLNALDEEIAQTVTTGRVKTLVFGDRFPFRYFVDDYGIDYYAAFPGCSAETEASFSTVIFLAQQLDRLGLTHIVIIDGSDGAIARSIVDNSSEKNQQTVVFDSMQSVAAEEIDGGVSYISIMQKNVEALVQALS